MILPCEKDFCLPRLERRSTSLLEARISARQMAILLMPWMLLLLGKRNELWILSLASLEADPDSESRDQRIPRKYISYRHFLEYLACRISISALKIHVNQGESLDQFERSFGVVEITAFCLLRLSKGKSTEFITVSTFPFSFYCLNVPTFFAFI